ncbi:MAG: hypothetical protein M0R17_05630 [Candidatus Omnitrophica bacterium]|jgi:hypothetical protein|nr:hypothetical protein [Candidatus Omnitrophota bacterium]
MSEHTEIKGECNYLHIPYREEGFSYCRNCKKFSDKLEVQFNEGWMSDWMEVRCGKCYKTIWVCEFKDKHSIEMKNKKYKDKEDNNKEGMRIFVKDDEKCEVCKKPTNHYDCLSSGFFGLYNHGKEFYICSNKCNKIMDKKFDKLREEYEKSKDKSDGGKKMTGLKGKSGRKKGIKNKPKEVKEKIEEKKE